MSELKPCPVTQIQAYRAYEKLLEIMEDETDDQTEAFSAAYKALYWIANDYRAQPANEPLTLDELRKMRGQVVDIPESEFWYSGRGTVLDDGVYDPKDQDGYWPFECYGEWLAYDHKQGGEQE